MTPPAPPVIQSALLSCAECRHEWPDYIVTQCDLRLSMASMHAIADRGCPACGAGNKAVLLKQTPYVASDTSTDTGAVTKREGNG